MTEDNYFDDDDIERQQSIPGTETKHLSDKFDVVMVLKVKPKTGNTETFQIPVARCSEIEGHNVESALALQFNSKVFRNILRSIVGQPDIEDLIEEATEILVRNGILAEGERLVKEGLTPGEMLNGTANDGQPTGIFMKQENAA